MSWRPRAGVRERGSAADHSFMPSCPTLTAGRSHVMQRVLSAVQFLWVLGQALVDGLTRWLHDFTRHHRAISDVLRAERYLLTRELLRVSGLPRPRRATPPGPPPTPTPRPPSPHVPPTTTCPAPTQTPATPPHLPKSVDLRPWLPCRAERCAGTCWTSCTPAKPRQPVMR